MSQGQLQGKDAEVQYVQRMADVLQVSREEVLAYLAGKPYSDAVRHRYLLDLGQIFQLLPPPPCRVLDLGVGPGWTSYMLARSGYVVVGLDIAADMIAIGQAALPPLPNLELREFDYEQPLPFGEFDAALIYDALHHAERERAVIENVYQVLRPGGVFVTAEPGAGHSTTEDSQRMMRDFQTTEKDMPYVHQRELMVAAGFVNVRQFIRLSELPILALTPGDAATAAMQIVHFSGLLYNTIAQGFTSLVVAEKPAAAAGRESGQMR